MINFGWVDFSGVDFVLGGNYYQKSIFYLSVYIKYGSCLNSMHIILVHGEQIIKVLVT